MPSSTTSTCSAPSPWPPSTSLLEKWFELSSQKLGQAEIRTVDNWMKDGKLNVDRQIVVYIGSSESRLVDTNLAERRQPVSMLAENMLIDNNSLGENRMTEHMAAESRLIVTRLAERRQPVSILAESIPIDNGLAENRMAEHIAAESRLVDTSLAERRISKYVGRK